MKHFLRFLFSFASLVASFSVVPSRGQAPAFDRAVTCGSAENPYGWGPKKLTVDANGNTYIVGTFNGTTVFGNITLTAAGSSSAPGIPAPPDVFVAKLDPAGNYLWAVQASGTLWDEVTGLTVDGNGNACITGYFDSFSLSFGNGISLFNSSALSEIYVAKLDGNTGQWLWAKRAGGTYGDATCGIATNSLGEVYLGGNCRSTTANFGQFTVNATLGSIPFVAKLSPSGVWLWAKQVGSGRLNAESFVADNQGHSYLAGSFNGPSVNFGATTLATQSVPGSPSATGNEVFVVKLDDIGTQVWAVQGFPNGQNLASSTGMTLDKLGHLYLVGQYMNQAVRLGSIILPNLSVMQPSPPQAPVPYTNNYGSDAFVARLDAATGTWQWAVRAGGAYNDAIGAVISDGQGKLYVAGGTYGIPGFDDPLAAGRRVQIAQLDDATGAWRWTLPLVFSQGN